MSVAHVQGRARQAVPLTTLAANIKRARAEAGLTQVELAELAECTDQYISEIERGKVPSLKVLANIAIALDVALSELFKGVFASELLVSE